jgi:hypothetical protein
VSWWVVIGVLVAAEAFLLLQLRLQLVILRRTLRRSLEEGFAPVIADLRAMREELRSFRP